MIETMKNALKYAIAKSENPTKIKEYIEEYFATIGGDRRYKFKWRAISGNHKYTFQVYLSSPDKNTTLIKC